MRVEKRVEISPLPFKGATRKKEKDPSSSSTLNGGSRRKGDWRTRLTPFDRPGPIPFSTPAPPMQMRTTVGKHVPLLFLLSPPPPPPPPRPPLMLNPILKQQSSHDRTEDPFHGISEPASLAGKEIEGCQKAPERIAARSPLFYFILPRTKDHVCAVANTFGPTQKTPTSAAPPIPRS